MNNEQLLNYISSIVQDILAEVASADNLTEEESSSTLIERIAYILDQFGLTIEQVLPQQVIENYFGGVDEATNLLNSVGVNAGESLALSSSGQVAKRFQSTIHMEAVEEILEDTLLDLRAAIRTAKRSASISINNALEAVKEDIANGLITGDPNKVVSQRVMDSFSRNGLTSFVTSDGKHLPLDYYSRLTVRTKMRDAGVKGATNRYLENDVELVEIDERADTCHVCAKYRGMVVSLTGEHEGFPSVDEVSLPPYHPHCRGTVRPFVIRYKNKNEVEKAKKLWENFNPEKDTRTAAQKRAYEKEQAIRRKANEEKKQYARYKSLLGDDAPKTLGAFRRIKRNHPDSYNELKHKYRTKNIEVTQRNRILSGYYPYNIKRGDQNKHIEGTNEYKLHVLKLEKRGDKPSILYKDADELLRKYRGTGRIISKSTKTPPKESIKTDSVVGRYYDKKSGKYLDTNWLMVIYSKNGSHLYPKKGDEF